MGDDRERDDDEFWYPEETNDGVTEDEIYHEESGQRSQTERQADSRRDRDDAKRSQAGRSGNGGSSGRKHAGSKASSAHRKPGRRSSTARRRRKRKKNGLNGHAIFFIVIAVIFVLTIIRLLVWNVGKRSGYDPNEQTDEFDVELLDYVQPLDPAALAGREDDGVTTVLALGNDPFSDERGDNGLTAQMAQATGAVIYNCAFPGSTISMKHTEFQGNYPLDGVSLYLLCAALCNQNFELMDVVTQQIGDETSLSALDTLKSIDMETVDALVIFYDLQDYKDGRIVYDENNLQNLNTVFGALNGSIRLLQETYPYIRIFLLSPTYGSFTKADGSIVDADRDDLGNGTLTDYINWLLEACRSNGITFIDTYYGAVTMEDTDCLEEGFHLNDKGRQKVAKRFADVFPH